MQVRICLDELMALGIKGLLNSRGYSVFGTNNSDGNQRVAVTRVGQWSLALFFFCLDQELSGKSWSNCAVFLIGLIFLDMFNFRLQKY